MAIQALSVNKSRFRRVMLALVVLAVVSGSVWYSQKSSNTQPVVTAVAGAQYVPSELAIKALSKLVVKGRAPGNDYERSAFGSGWASVGGCDMRNRVLARDMYNVVKREDGCVVVSGELVDPYTSKTLLFVRGDGTSSAVQIDHVVALSDAWQKGAALMTEKRREEFANDPLNLLAVDGPTNIKKGDGDAATWLPPNKSFRCRYVARQIAVKIKYSIWVTTAESDSMERILNTCPAQVLPISMREAAV